MSEETTGIGKNEYLFQHLVAMFQTLALQQLGKLINPITGKLERDLHQARITIDMLQMLQVKTAGNLDGNEKRLLDAVVMELQMNYVDEMQRAEESGAEEDKEEIAKSSTGESAGSEASTEEAEALGPEEKEEKGGSDEQPDKASPKKKKSAKPGKKKKT